MSEEPYPTVIGWNRAKKKPVEIDFREPIPNGVMEYGFSKDLKTMPVEWVETREGKIMAIPGVDFVIQGVRGELYPIKKDIFYETYDIIVCGEESNEIL